MGGNSPLWGKVSQHPGGDVSILTSTTNPERKCFFCYLAPISIFGGIFIQATLFHPETIFLRHFNSLKSETNYRKFWRKL